MKRFLRGGRDYGVQAPRSCKSLHLAEKRLIQPCAMPCGLGSTRPRAEVPRLGDAVRLGEAAEWDTGSAVWAGS